MRGNPGQWRDAILEYDAAKLPPLPPLPAEHAQRPFLHPSARELAGNGVYEEYRSYEPYEFIGDKILSTFILTALKLLYPRIAVKAINKVHEVLTMNATFAALALEYGFASKLRTGTHTKTQKQIADTFEAYFGVLWYYDIQRTAFLGISNLIPPELHGSFFPFENGGAVDNRNVATSNQARKSDPFSSMLQWSFILVRDAFPKLSLYVQKLSVHHKSVKPVPAVATSSTGNAVARPPKATNANKIGKNAVRKQGKIGIKALRRQRRKQRRKEVRRSRQIEGQASGSRLPTASGGQMTGRQSTKHRGATSSPTQNADASKRISRHSASGSNPRKRPVAIVIDSTDDESDEAVRMPPRKLTKLHNTQSGQAASSRTAVKPAQLVELDSTDSGEEQDASSEESEEDTDPSRSDQGTKGLNTQRDSHTPPQDGVSVPHAGQPGSSTIRRIRLRVAGTGTTEEPFEFLSDASSDDEDDDSNVDMSDDDVDGDGADEQDDNTSGEEDTESEDDDSL